MKKLITSAVLAASTMGPMAASAEVSSNMAVSNMYLYRGFNLTPNSPAVSGGVDFEDKSGAYAGTWASSEDGGYELDLYVGYKGKAGDVAYDVGYITYNYPEEGTSLTDGNATEVKLAAEMGDFSAELYVNTDSANDYSYLSLDYSMGKVGLHVGLTEDSTLDGDTTANDEVTDVNISYELSSELKATLSIADGDTLTEAQKNPLLALTYELPISKK